MFSIFNFSHRTFLEFSKSTNLVQIRTDFYINEFIISFGIISFLFSIGYVFWFCSSQSRILNKNMIQTMFKHIPTSYSILIILGLTQNQDALIETFKKILFFLILVCVTSLIQTFSISLYVYLWNSPFEVRISNVVFFWYRSYLNYFSKFIFRKFWYNFNFFFQSFLKFRTFSNFS